MTEDSADPRETEHHPRRRTKLTGHAAAEQRLLQGYLSGRLHHAWLIHGPKGIGKATLAYRLARFILHHPDPASAAGHTSLYVPPEAPAARRVGARAHANLLAIERTFVEKDKKLKSEIGVDVARAAGEFFGQTAGEAGWRIAIIDSADDLNRESANALLKHIEEPPHRSLFLVVAHQPGQLLATIRSRCIALPLSPLSLEETLAVLQDVGAGDDLGKAAELSGGSPGRALELTGSKGAAQFRRFAEIANSGRIFTPAQKFLIADGFTGRGGSIAEDFDVFCALITDWAGRAARAHGLKGGGAEMARAHDEICHSIRLTNALNLDRRQTVLEAISAIESAAKLA